MIKAVIFALDDTLYPERDYVESGFLEVARYLAHCFEELNEAEVYCHLMTLFQQGIRDNIFNLVLDVFNIPQNNGLIHELVRIYQEHTPKITPFPDCLPNLIEFKEQEYSLGIITDGLAKVQKKKITALGLEDYFDSIIYTDDYGRENRKPSQQPYRLSLEELRVSPDQAIYVGDNPTKDFFGGAKAMGLYTTLISRPGEEQSRVRKESYHEADAVTYSLSGLWKIIRWLQSWYSVCTTGRLIQRVEHGGRR